MPHLLFVVEKAKRVKMCHILARSRYSRCATLPCLAVTETLAIPSGNSKSCVSLLSLKVSILRRGFLMKCAPLYDEVQASCALPSPPLMLSCTPTISLLPLPPLLPFLSIASVFPLKPITLTPLIPFVSVSLSSFFSLLSIIYSNLECFFDDLGTR